MEHMYKLRHGRQVVNLYFPKYIDKVHVVFIEIKQTCLITLGGYFNMFLFVLKTFSGSDIV